MANYAQDIADAKTELRKILKKSQNKRSVEDFARVGQLRNLIAGVEAQSELDQAFPGVEEEAPIPTEAVQEETEGDPEEIVVLTRTTLRSDCETAHEDGCTCRCRGKYHGDVHPKGWKDEEGCEPLTKAEKKDKKKKALYAWRVKHPERVSAYMKAWRTEKKSKEAADAAEENGNAE